MSLEDDDNMLKIDMLHGNRHFISFNPLKPKLVQMLFKNSVHTSERTPHFTITKISWIMLFREIITIYNYKHIKATNIKYRVTDS
jgi:hypothetical protein